MKPDILAEIRLFRTEDGGREGPTPPDKFGCVFEINGKYFECRLILNGVGPLSPGRTATVPINFLSPELVKEELKSSPHLGR